MSAGLLESNPCPLRAHKNGLRRIMKSSDSNPLTTQVSHSSMLHSNSAALSWAIAEQRAVLPLECRPIDDLALCGADCASSARDQVMRVRCSVVVVSAQLDWMMADVLYSMRQEAIAA